MFNARTLTLAFTLTALLAAGCGTTAPGQSGLGVKPAAPATPAKAAVKVQKEAFDLTSKDAGRFEVSFKGLGGYKTLATVEDIHSVRIVLASARLVEPMVKTVGPEALNQVIVTVPFTGVPAGDVTVKVQALDKDGRVIGAKESPSTVGVNQTTVLQMAVRLDANTGTGSLGAAITFENPSPAPSTSPSPSPSASPSPSPSPSATPAPASPVILESSRLIKHLFSNPDAEIQIKNTAATSVSAKVYAYFYLDNTLVDKQAREIPLTGGQSMTFKVKANVYRVNKLSVVVQ